MTKNIGRRRGFTLIELLVVIFIILLVSVVALGSGALSSYNHREVSEAGRILQGALVGARDKAIHDGQPCGIRLLPDPTFPITWMTSGGVVTQINPYTILAYNRIVPIDSAPEYCEGAVSVYPTANMTSLGILRYSTINGGVVPFLVLEEAVLGPPPNYLPNSPTSWAWNVRVGDQVQINNSGNWYTVIGPMTIGPNNGNTELFVNYPSPDPLASPVPAPRNPEYLFLVNGRDDNKNGWIDEGFDGVDNDGVFGPDQPNNINEWEPEYWVGIPAPSQTTIPPGASMYSVPYTIRRRPAPAPNAREIALPTSMVIDATSIFIDRERSRLPANNPLTLLTGYIDVVLNPDGTVLPTTTYSSPASFGMDQSFYHFWLAERQDLNDVAYTGGNAPTAITWAGGTAPYYLPIAQPGAAATSSLLPAPFLKGQYSVLTLFARTGQIVVNANPPFLYNSSLGYNNQNGAYNANNPFIPAELGVNGGP